jgi:hypothetical protein
MEAGLTRLLQEAAAVSGIILAETEAILTI